MATMPRDDAHVCGARHACRAGGHGACDSVRGHAGAHWCGSCDSLFAVPDASAAGWCRLPCPECASACRRPAGHAGGHACDRDHVWSLAGRASAPVSALSQCAHCDRMLDGIARFCRWCGRSICPHCSADNCPFPDRPKAGVPGSRAAVPGPRPAQDHTCYRPCPACAAPCPLDLDHQPPHLCAVCGARW